MSIGLEITYPDPEKLPVLLRLSKGLSDTGTRKVMGRAIVTLCRKHFSDLDEQRANKLGGQRTHFYGAARRAVGQPELLAGDGLKVSIAHEGLAQRYYGGDIVAKDAGALTLPVHPAAHGKRAREFSDLELIPTPKAPKAKAILARPNEQSANGIGEVYYVLVKRVTQEPDPSVLPSDNEILHAALHAGDAHIKRLISRN